MSYKPHKKQVAAHLAFLMGGYKRGVLLWGRQCFAKGSLVRLADGTDIPIEDIKEGMQVISYNPTLGVAEPREVRKLHCFGANDDPKPMIEWTVNGQTITSTYDHEYYSDGRWVPLYQLAWGKMAPSQRTQLKLLCEQSGQTLDDKIQGWVQNTGDETSTRSFWVLEDSVRRQDCQGASDSSPDMAPEPTQQTLCQSHRQRPDEQQDREPGVGDSGREPSAYRKPGATSVQSRGEVRDTYSNDQGSVDNTGVPAQVFVSDEQPCDEQVSSRPVHHTTGQYTGYFKRQELEISEVRVRESAIAYDLTVADNQNYVVHGLLVHNSGKSFWAVNHAWLSAVLSQGRYFIVFKTYKQAHEVIWRQYVPMIPKELVYKKNEQDLLIELNYMSGPVYLPDGTMIEVEHDQTKPRSTIQLLGSDQADSHRGFRANGMIFDEYADQDPNNWDAVYKHFFTTTDGWAVFVGTPRGFNHFYDMIQYAQDDERWFFLKATWRDSPYVKKEFIDEERREADKQGKLSTFLQEVELEFRAVQGAVYPNFNRDIHIVKPGDIPPLGELSIYAGIDFGYHTTACIFVGVDKDQNWWVFDEVYGRQEVLVDLMPRINHKIADQRLILMIGDSQGKDAIETMVLKGFPIVPVVKRADSIIHGIDLVRKMLKPRIQLVGPPKPSIFFSSVCKNLIREIEAYKYPEDKPERNPSELPMKQDDHGPDALRYIALHLKYGVNREDKLPASSALKELGDYGLL